LLYNYVNIKKVMIIKVILVRHGETEWNKKRIFRGRVDVKLNKKGIEQAKLLSRALSNLEIRKIYSSPLARAKDTAKVIADSHKLKVRVNKSFIDLDYGDWQGFSEKIVKEQYPHLYQEWKMHPQGVKIPGGESLRKVRVRAVQGLKRIVSREKEGTIIIVSHRVVGKVLICALLGLDNSSFWQIKLDTAAFSIFDYNYNNFVLTLHNQTHHLERKWEERCRKSEREKDF